MSVRMTTAVWELDLPQPLKLLALALADWANDEGGNIRPSLAYVAWKIGTTERTVRRQMRLLEAEGIVEVESEKGYQLGSGQWTRLYRLHPEKGTQLPPERGDDLAPLTERGDTGGHEGGTSEAERGDTHAPLYVSDTSVDTLDKTAPAKIVTPRARKPQDDYWDALAAVMGHGPELGEEPLWGRFTNRVLRSGVSTEEFRIRAERLALQWGIGKLTVRSLERHWERFGAPIGAVAPHQEDAMQAEFAARATSAALAEYDRVKRLNPPSGPPVTGEGTPA